MERIYVVSGGSSGIGLAVSDYLIGRGDRVIGVDLHDSDVNADLSTQQGCAQAVSAARDLAGGTIHGAIACAGIGPNGDNGGKVLAVNFYGAVRFLEGLRPHLDATSNAGAVAVASAATQHPVDHELVRLCLDGSESAAMSAAAEDVPGAYVVSKLALVRWVRRCAPSADWAGANLSLNAVSPALVRTPLFTANTSHDPDIMKRLLARYPMRLHGIATAEQVAPLIGFLVAGENSHVTGQNIFVDGGAEAITRGDVIW